MSDQFQYCHVTLSSLPALLAPALNGTVVELDGNSFHFPYNPALWTVSARKRASMRAATLADTVSNEMNSGLIRFHNFYGTGVDTPVGLVYSVPVPSLDRIGEHLPTPQFDDGDGTVRCFRKHGFIIVSFGIVSS